MAFRIGQKVRIVRGGTASREGHSASSGLECIGTVTTVASSLMPCPHDLCDEILAGTPIHILDLVDPADGLPVACPPSWLEPYDDGREPAAWTEDLRKLCGVKQRESA